MHRKYLRATVGTADVDIPTGTFIADRFLYYNGIAIITVAAVRGPVSSTDNAVTRWDGTTGTLVQNSVVIISDTGAVTGVTTLNGRDPARWVDGPLPAASTDNAVARWDGTGGRLIQDSVVVISDTGAVTGVTTMNGTDPGRWVQGPISGGSTDNALARWDGTTGRLIQNSVVIVDDTGAVTGITTINGTPVGDFVRGPTPALSFDNVITRWDGISGRLIQTSAVSIDDSGNIAGAGTLNTRTISQWADGPVAGGSTNNATALWDGTTGRLLKNSNVVMDPTTGDITTPGEITTPKVAGIPTGVLVKSSGGTPHPDNVITRWSSASGHPLKDSTVTLDDTGNMTSLGTLNGRTIANWVDGPASSTNDSIPYFVGTSGKQIGNSGLSINTVVDGPGASTDNAVARWNGTGGITIKNSSVIISDAGAVTGVTTLNGVDPATWVVGPASATTGNVASFNSTTGKVIADSGVIAARLLTAAVSGTTNRVVTYATSGTRAVGTSPVAIDPANGNITGAGTYNGVNVATHAARHLGGGADTLFAGGLAVGDLLAFGGAGSLITKATTIPSRIIANSSGVGVINTTSQQVAAAGIITDAATYLILVAIPYALTDTGSNMLFSATWGPGTVGAVGISVGAGGGLLTSSGATGSLAMSGIPPAGIIFFVCGYVHTSGSGGVNFYLGTSGAAFNTYRGFCYYVSSS